jgi:tetratricopeptide (TPR) repeat protein
MANRLASLSILAALTFVPTSLQAQNLATNAASPSSPLTDDVMNKMLQLIDSQGTDRELIATVANTLGLSPTGKTWASRSVTLGDVATSFRGFYVSRGSDRDILVSMVRPLITVHAFRALRNGKVVTAFISDLKANKTTMRTPKEAQHELDTELAFWAANVDKLQQWGWCNGQPGGAKAVSPELRIRGCTSRIQSTVETPRTLALAYVKRGEAYNTKHDKDAAAKDFDQAVKVDPSFALAWAESCSFHMWISHDSDRAQKECGTAIKLDPKDASGWTYRGDIFLNLREYERAIQDYNQAIEVNPKWMWPWDNRGEAYLRSNKIDRAIQDFEQVIKLSPDYAMGYLDRGMAYIRKKQLELALADFETGLKVDPKSASSLFGRGLVKRLKGDRAGGDADIASAQAMSPKVAEAFEKNGIEIP